MNDDLAHQGVEMRTNGSGDTGREQRSTDDAGSRRGQQRSWCVFFPRPSGWEALQRVGSVNRPPRRGLLRGLLPVTIDAMYHLLSWLIFWTPCRFSEVCRRQVGQQHRGRPGEGGGAKAVTAAMPSTKSTSTFALRDRWNQSTQASRQRRWRGWGCRRVARRISRAVCWVSERAVVFVCAVRGCAAPSLLSLALPSRL